MIVDFTIKNYLSIQDEVTLSFLANSKKDSGEYKKISVEDGRYKLYPFSAIYGANASGKTNVIKALNDFQYFVMTSNRAELDEPLSVYKPFKLDKASLESPTEFSIEFVTNGMRYRYSIAFTKTKVINEELYFFPNVQSVLLFHRDEDLNVKYGSSFKGEKKSLEVFLLPNKLFLSLVANSKNNILDDVYRFFRDEIVIHVQMDSSRNLVYSTTRELRKNAEFKKKVIAFLQAADLGVTDLMLRKREIKNSDVFKFPDNMPEEIKEMIKEDLSSKPFLGHAVYDNGEKTDEIEFFNLETEESSGTIKMYDLASEILGTLETGDTLVVDEFNSGMHPALNEFLTMLFMNPEINKNDAQLLVATHDVCALDMQVLQREQIWFANKSPEGVTDLYSLDEFDKNVVRENGKYGKFYMDGRFEAVPAIDYQELIKGVIDA